MGAGREPDGSSRSDEEWDQFLRESVAGVADSPKEPSALARDVVNRLRAEPSRQPEGRRTHTPAQPERRTRWYVVGLLASLVLLVVALAPGRTVDLFGGDDADSSPAAAESARPTQAPPTEAAQRPTMDKPFRGSPAAAWESGSAGITVPKAKAVGWMSAAEVERALARSRDFLVESSLDRGVLRGERPKAAIALINAHQKDVQDFLDTAFRSPSEENDPLFLFSRFQSSRTRLVGDVVKTRGRLSYREGERGALQVTADVTFVYPVTRAHPSGDDEIVRTIVRRELVLNWDDPDKVITKPGTFSIVSYKYDVTNGGCGAATGYFTPPFGSDRRTDETGTEVDPYDRSVPVGSAGSSEEECGAATRS
ncbi:MULTISPECIES: hypothetical protein [Streptomyces]|uniref:hypothetical protein n=1 Tax=Streptomyces scabiei TaxID=1930 RepID=UPI0004E73CF2|nr:MULTISPECIES: hypothetical protein [Streptomyces]MBP5859294.1 hypothetical protein [Streptomyces sp. LBUM 1484]KFG08682.1 membrane protein [Streptomyces scabiei]MBP5880569.1 hypothetical protein [Streptomyces sp. LBUM 1477]MBP5888406.1 hypothetical protein [Streptomyces sp. LBUM 1487]MBP5904429.1 hypothetical protein [Streptomyces sp. LBUM 1488]